MFIPSTMVAMLCAMVPLPSGPAASDSVLFDPPALARAPWTALELERQPTAAVPPVLIGQPTPVDLPSIPGE